MNDKNAKILKTGKLLKCSKYLGHWKMRYVVLTDKYLLTYEEHNLNSECTMDLQLSECFGPKYITTQDNLTFGFFADGKKYLFKAKDEKERDDWFNILQEKMSKDK